MQPPAEVEPARVSITVQSLSASMRLKIFVALARSREVNDILLMASTIGRASNEVISICSIGVDSNSAFGEGLVFLVGFIPCSFSLPPHLSNAPHNNSSPARLSFYPSP